MIEPAPVRILGTVLVADSSSERRDRVSHALEARGFVAVTAATIAETQVVAARRPDVIILGELSPDEELGVVAQLRDDPLTIDLPILRWSDHGVDPDEHVRSLRTGASMYLGHDASNEALVASVEALLRFRDRQRELEVALSVRGSGIFEWIIATGEVRWSPSLEKVHGLETGQFGGTFEDFMRFVHPDELDRVGAVIGNVVEAGEAYGITYRGVRVDAGPLWIEGHGRVFRDFDGQATKLLGVALDVTERETNLLRVEEIRTLAAELNTDDSTAAVMATVTKALAAHGYLAELQKVGGRASDSHSGSIRYATDRFVLELVPASTVDEGAGVTDVRGQVGTIADLAVNALLRAGRYEAERETASALQRAVLPAELPELVGWQIDAAYEAAVSGRNRLGGDFYDVVVLDRWLVGMIGDVSGHGLAATAQMSSIRNMLRTLAILHDGDPARILGQAASLASAVLGTQATFITTAVASIDRTSGAGRYASAGHPPALLRQTETTHVLNDRQSLMPPVGATRHPSEPPAHTFELSPGDTMVFYTDGVIERRNELITDSVNRLKKLIEAAGAPLSAQLVLDITSDEALNDDDRAVLCITRE